jgi:hypothetical protein
LKKIFKEEKFMKQVKRIILSVLLICCISITGIHEPLVAYASNTGEGRVGNVAGVNYYYIRNVDYGNYLTASANPLSGASITANSFSESDNSLLMWKVTKISTGVFHISPYNNVDNGIAACNPSGDGTTIQITTQDIADNPNSTESQWEVRLQSDGTWKIYSLSGAFEFDNGTKVLGLSYNASGFQELTLRNSSSAGTSWFFEEVLGTSRDLTSPVISYDYTIKRQGYTEYTHAAYDVAYYRRDNNPVGNNKQIVYAPFDGSIHYWVSTCSIDGQTYTNRLGNFITIESSLGGVMFAHLDSFYNNGLASNDPGTRHETAMKKENYNPVIVASGTVWRGQKIAYTGTTGSATGNHLHVEYYPSFAKANAVWHDPSSTQNTWIYASTDSSSSVAYTTTYKNSVADSHDYLKHWG